MSATSHEEKASRGPVADRLQGKVVLMTGIGGGMGREVSLVFAKAAGSRR